MINYEDKEKLQDDETIARKNKVTADDMNEIKIAVNSIYEILGLINNNWDSAGVYSIGDIVVDNYQLYENMTGTNTTTKPSEDTTNWKLTSILVDE